MKFFEFKVTDQEGFWTFQKREDLKPMQGYECDSRPALKNLEAALTVSSLGGVTSCECSISKHSDVVLHGFKLVAADEFVYV